MYQTFFANDDVNNYVMIDCLQNGFYCVRQNVCLDRQKVVLLR